MVLVVPPWVAVLCACIAADAGGPATEDGLVLHLSAADSTSLELDGDAVVSWRSRDSARTPFTAGPEQRPTLVRRDALGLPPVVQFDGIDDVLVGALPATSPRQWTLLVVFSPTSNRQGEGALLSARAPEGNDYDSGLTVDMRYSRDAFEELNVEGAGRIGATMDLLQRSYPFGESHLVVVERDDGEVRLRVDGLREMTRAVTPAETSLSEVRIGARFYHGRECGHLDGGISEIMLYRRILAPEELASVIRALTPTDEYRAKEKQLAMQGKAERDRNRMVAPQVLEEWPDVGAFARARPADAPPLSELPIRGDLREAIELCMQCLNSSFDRDRDGEPFFYANCRADGTGEMHHSVNIGIPHVVGRALWGAMIGEQATGIPFPVDGLRILERYLRASFDNEDDLNSYYDPARGGARFVEFHNMREGLYGLVALVWGRKSAWAQEQADRMLARLDALTDPDSGRWSIERAQALGMAERCEGLGVPNAARMVDPLLAYHRLTGSQLALKLAGQYARAGLDELFSADGTFAPMDRSSGHIHSITSSLSGIVDYAAMADDAAMLERCRRIVDRGVPACFSSWGWGDEVMPDHPADVPGRGEINQTGDVVRAALLLGDAGYPDYYDLAERYTRSMLMPTQHREPELRRFLRNVADPKSDAERDVLERAVGGYAMQLPNDRMREGDWPLSTLDITSGAVHALSEVYMRRCVVAGDHARVIMLFDADTAGLRVESALPLEGRIRCTAKRALSLDIRVPGWVAPRSVALSVNGRKRDARIRSGFATVGRLESGDVAELTFAVPCRVERETVDSVVYTTTWVGDQVISIEPRGTVSPLPF